jgi:hypothetical protein
MRSTVLVLVLAMSAPVTLTGCDQLKDLLGDKKASTSKEDDDHDARKPKQDKDLDEGDSKSAKSDSSSAPSPPASVGQSSTAHMPAGCEFVVTMNLSKVTSHPAVTKELLPVVQDLLATPSPKDPGVKKLQAVAKTTGLSLKSLQNLAYCSIHHTKGKGPDTYAMAIGGDFKPETIIPAFEKTEDPGTVLDIDGRKALKDKTGAVAGQFGDAVFGLGSNTDVFKSMSTTPSSAYQIDPSRDLSFVMNERFIKTFLKEDAKELKGIKAMTGASGWIDLSAAKVEVRLITGSPDDAKKLDRLIALFAGDFAAEQKPGSVETC